MVTLNHVLWENTAPLSEMMGKIEQGGCLEKTKDQETLFHNASFGAEKGEGGLPLWLSQELHQV